MDVGLRDHDADNLLRKLVNLTRQEMTHEIKKSRMNKMWLFASLNLEVTMVGIVTAKSRKR